MRQLFHQLVRPMANSETVGAFLNGLRIVVIDGTCLDIPDSDENARVFGRPGSRPGTRAAFPKVRLVILVEAGTHLIFDAIRVPISDWRASQVTKIITLGKIRNVVDVG
jgi:hypothetical protein